MDPEERSRPRRRTPRPIPAAAPRSTSRPKRAVSILGSVAALATLAAGPLRAQLSPPVRFELAGGAGALLPGTDLVRADSLPGGVQLGGSFALHGSAGLHLPGGFGIEGHLVWAPNAALEGTGGTKLGRADWMALTLNGVYRPPLPILSSVLEPFLGAGLGVRRLYPERPIGTFQCPRVPEIPCPPVLQDASDRSEFAVEGMLGTEVALPGLWRLRVELRDYLTSFEDRGDARLQSDLAVLGGLVLRVP